jgi:arylsulfatase A-like enzyme
MFAYRTQPSLSRDGQHNELATGFPGYNGMMPKEKAAIGAMLRQYGYNTYCVGKWHDTPEG